MNAAIVYPQNTGSLCVPHLPGKSDVPELAMSPPNEYIAPDSILQVQIDNGKPLIVSPEKGVKFDKLSLNGKHLIKIRINNRLKSSFYFSLKNQASENLCLFYYKGYGTFHFKPAKECKCDE
jgi:hypothetical protein